MDASKITQLRQQQASKYINRAQQSVDASVITWQQQIQSSRYLPQTTTATPPTDPANLGGCKTCGGFATTNILTNTTVRKPNPYFSAKGSGNFINSCDAVTYKRAGDQYCGTTNVNGATTLDQQFIQLPSCFCNNVDRWLLPGTTNQYSAPPPLDAAQAWLNPYLPNPKPYVANTEPAPCVSCNHYSVINPQTGLPEVSTRINPECPNCPRRATDPSVLP